MPYYLANKACTDMNGYFGCKSAIDTKQTLVDFSIWFRCLVKVVQKSDEGPTSDGKEYWWREMAFFMRWSPRECRVLCIGTPPCLRQSLPTALEEQHKALLEIQDPFAMILPIVDQIIELYDDSIWRIRDQVRLQELNRERQTKDFVAMHDATRHTNHLVEVHAVTIETLEQMLQQQKCVYENLPAGTLQEQNLRRQASEYLRFQLYLMKSLHCRSISINERMSSETALAYNIIASEDNATMKSIALLTMTVLPATFISVGNTEILEA
ncbi:hypothetical protein HIM_07457 [Hirsutella minnesotensis 3608]|uniref:Uncharacterized protein n=1 Tax=Hirsutella minnesotensis 3608 TaxID=1043627 RepID=A0A0F7ZTG5_9HYPO|nr:hypothetical protein HIM_07457 [Hirsutella minnesotensis 3608]